MASLTQWTWVWVSSRSWWWTGRPGVLQSMGSQTVRHDGATELNWVELSRKHILPAPLCLPLTHLGFQEPDYFQLTDSFPTPVVYVCYPWPSPPRRLACEQSSYWLSPSPSPCSSRDEPPNELLAGLLLENPKELFRASLVAQLVKHLPAMQETWVRSLGQEDPLEKGMATHSSILSWRSPWTEETGGLPVHGVAKSQTWPGDYVKTTSVWINVSWHMCIIRVTYRMLSLP